MAGVWTNNWKGVKNWMLLGPNTDIATDLRNGWDTIYGLNGNVITTYGINAQVYPISPVGYYYNANVATSYGGPNNVIVFGTASVTPSATDYCLGAKWESNISRISLSQSESYDDNTYTKTKIITCAVQNTGATAVTIKEWGIESRVGRQEILLYHASISTPVTLQQYESATFTCTITLQLTDPI